MRLLLEYGASPSVPATQENLTPLHEAASRGYAEVVRELVAHGADVNARWEEGVSDSDLVM